MNKLEEYKDKRLNNLVDYQGMEEKGFTEDEIYKDGYNKGFDEAIALDLPVKFAEWYKSIYDLSNPRDGEENAFADMSWKELYKYWIDNIYKPE